MPLLGVGEEWFYSTMKFKTDFDLILIEILGPCMN